MIRKILNISIIARPLSSFFRAIFIGLMLGVGSAYAVDINLADQTALESVKGLGPSKAKAILEERQKNGPFRDAADLQNRVKGFGEKTITKLTQNGLVIQAGASKAGTNKGASSSEVTGTKPRASSKSRSDQAQGSQEARPKNRIITKKD